MSSIPKLPNKWHELLASEFDQPYMKQLGKFLKQEYETKIVYPAKKNVFRSLQQVDYEQIRVCVIGQDPYHGPDQANGFAFAVNNGCPCPPSLRNIFKELHSSCGIPIPQSTSLEGWGRQGVLLLNTVLTVRASEAFSHRNKGWEVFTDKVIEHLNNRQEPIIFVLWGSAAKAKQQLITNRHHHILTSAHPSPLSAQKFFGCNHFKIINEILKEPIDWSQVD